MQGAGVLLQAGIGVVEEPDLPLAATGCHLLDDSTRWSVRGSGIGQVLAAGSVLVGRVRATMALATRALDME